MTESKKHHFIPQCILKHFSVNEKSLYVFDKNTGRSYPSSVGDAAHENNFNAVQFGENKFNFESIFEDFDSVAGRIAGKLVAAKNYLSLTPDDVVDLARTVCIQDMRTKMPRTNIVNFAKDMREWMAGLGIEEAKNQVPVISEEGSKILALEKLEYLDELTIAIAMRGVMLVYAPDDYPFWTSDNPVLFDNHLPYSMPGYNVKGTDVFMPVSKNIGLLFVCREATDHLFEVYWKLKILGRGIPGDVEKLFSGIYRGNIIPLSRDHIDFYNSRQVQNSSRFLYGSLNQFAMANEMINEAPALKNISKTFGLGGSRRFSSMPMGEQIVFYFKDSELVIPVTLLPSEFDVEFRTVEIAKLLPLYKNKTKIERIEVFKDQLQTRLMRDVIISDIDGQLKVTLQHEDDIFGKIMRTIKSEKEKKQR